MHANAKNFSWTHVGLILLILTAAISWILLMDPAFYFNSDNITSFALVDDVIGKGNSLLNWNLSRAPYFFPDYLIYSLIWLVCGRRLPWSYFLFGVSNLLILSTLMFFLSSQMLPLRAQRRTTIGLLIPAVFLSLGQFGSVHEAIRWWSLMGHVGILNITLFCVWLIVRSGPGLRPWKGGAVGGLVALCVISDQVFFFATLLPLCLVVCAWVVDSFSTPVKRGFGLMILFWTSIGALVGLGLDYLIRKTVSVQSAHFSGGVSTGQSFSSLSAALLQEWQSDWSSKLFIMGCIAGFAGCCAAAWQSRKNEKSIAWGFLLSSPVVCLLVPPAMHIFVDTSCLRYSVAAFTFPWLGLAYWICFCPSNAQKWVIRTVGLGALALVVIQAGSQLGRAADGNPGNLFTYDPPLVKCLDQLAESGKIHDGIGEYWVAKSTRYLSKQGIRVLQIMPPFSPSHWGETRSWYPRLPNGDLVDLRLDFVVTAGLDEGEILKAIGAPDEKDICDQKVIFLYRNPTGLSALRSFFKGTD